MQPTVAEPPALLGQRFQLSGRRVARELDDIIRRRGQRPDTIVSDNGTELTSNVILG